MKKVIGFVFLCSLIGCGAPGDPSTGGQTGEEGIGCLPVSEQTLARDEISSLGFDAASVLANFSGTTTKSISWEDDSASETTFTVTDKGDYYLVDYEWIDDNDDGPAAAIAVDCPDRLEILVDVTVVTDDNALNESFETRLRARAADNALIYKNGDALDLGGDFDFANFGTPEKITYWYELNFVTDGPNGTFAGTREEERSGDVDSATALSFGTWGSPDTLF